MSDPVIKTTKKRWLSVVLTAGLLWLAWTALVHRIEMKNVFHPELAAYSNPLEALTSSPLKNKIQDVVFKAKDGTLLDGWYIPPQIGKPTIVFAHGNGGNIADRLPVIQLFSRAGYGFFAFDYRGYGRSQGQPSEQGLYQDLEAASRYLTTAKRTPLSKQIALGGSLGSGVVVDVATRLPFEAVVIYATLTSTPDVANHLFEKAWWRFLPVTRFMQYRFNSLSKIANIHSPLIIMHGTNDHMMPIWMPKALYSKAKAPYKKLLLIPGAGHDDVLELGQDKLLAELRQLLSKTTP